MLTAPQSQPPPLLLRHQGARWGPRSGRDLERQAPPSHWIGTPGPEQDLGQRSNGAQDQRDLPGPTPGAGMPHDPLKAPGIPGQVRGRAATTQEGGDARLLANWSVSLT